MIITILKKQLQQEEIMLKISKFITILVVFFSISNLAQAKQTLYFPKNDLGWEDFDIDYISHNKLGEKTSNSEFDRRIKAQIVKFKSHHEGALLHKDLKCKAPLIEPNLRRSLGKWST